MASAKARVRLGIVGAGKVANVCARALTGIGDIELRSACNHTRMRLQEFCQNFMLSGYLDCAEMICNEHLQALLICTPVPTHMYYARIACSYGCHILCQAPLSLQAGDLAFLIDYRTQQGRLVEEIDCHFRGSYLSTLGERLRRLQQGRKAPRLLDCRVSFNDCDTLYIMLQALCGLTGSPDPVLGQDSLALEYGRLRLSCSFSRGRHNFVELKQPRCREDFEDHLLGYDDLYNLSHVDPGYFDQKKLNQSIADYHTQLRQWAGRVLHHSAPEPYLECAVNLARLIAALHDQG